MLVLLFIEYDENDRHLLVLFEIAKEVISNVIKFDVLTMYVSKFFHFQSSFCCYAFTEAVAAKKYVSRILNC